jgi:3-hydroxybutyryl-CoA dehydrogenase
VLVVGAGIMGAGIAQVAAQAGHPVWLHDQRAGAAEEALGRLRATFEALVAKGKLDADQAQATLARIRPTVALADAAGAALVVEAIVEQLEAKRGLFRELEGLLGEQAVLASNTSSISVTAIANGLRRPERLVGMHFFNPVPLMKLVEVVSGLATDPAVAAAIERLSRNWGKVPVHAASTPGFIVNRIARPYYAETLALLQERAAAPEVLDACLKAAGFRMGPCELMDLIGHDTNFAVTRSVWEANFQDKRFTPSLVQRELVDGGLLGRKSGRGFYRYPEGVPALAPPAHGAPRAAASLVVHGWGPVAERLSERLGALLRAQPGLCAAPLRREPASAWTGLAVDGARLVLTDGRPAHERAAEAACEDLAVFDVFGLPGEPADPAAPPALAWAPNAGASAAWRRAAPAWLQALGFTPCELQDAPGLVVARTLAMLVNEAADAVQQGVCSPEGADEAMRLGVNYPAGPFAWHEAWGGAAVAAVVRALDAAYRGERYRLSPWLQRRERLAPAAAWPAPERALAA